jgi:hypothetical protein
MHKADSSTAFHTSEPAARRRRAGATAAIATSVAISTAAGLVPMAQAQEALCLAYEDAAKLLTQKHQEAPTAMGLTSSGQVMQLFRSSDGATWTLMLVTPDGLACAMASGEDWSDLPVKVAGLPS